MSHSLTGRFFTGLSIFLVFNAGSILAQKGGTGAGSESTGGRTGTSISAPTTTTRLPTTGTTSPGTPRMRSGPIFVSGSVATDDGTPIDTNTRIERVCGSTVHLESHVDSKGRFSFQIGNENQVDVDASNMYSPIGARPTDSPTSGITSAALAPGGIGQNGITGCELRAVSAGFHSDVIELSGHNPLDNPDVGVIVLHRLGKIDGTTTSLTTMAAPKQAKKLYEKGMQLVQKGKFDDAGKHFEQATSAYPEYAIAWEALGEMRVKAAQYTEAQTAFQSAIKADPKYVNPYEQLAFVFAHEKKWQDAVDASQRAITLDPVEFPGSFWCNAVANFNLNKHADAEKSIRALLKLDTQHRYPEAEKMMGQFLVDQGNVQEAAAHIKAYLAEAPNAPDADGLRRWLGKVDQASAANPAHPVAATR